MSAVHTAGGVHELQHDLATLGTQLREITVVIAVDPARARGNRRNAAMPRGGHGSGIVWSNDTIITNAHVAMADALTVTFFDGTSVPARVIMRDRQRDLAALRIDDIARLHGASGARTIATIGEPSQLRAGDVVVANGHPLGVEHALSLGVVHTAPRDASRPYISADIRLAPGNSGGPLADARGRVVGVNSMIVGGLGVAISVDAVRRMLAASLPRPSLGVQLRQVQVRVPARTGDASVGLLVLGCDATGAAARAGILPGDVLLGFAGRPFRSADELALLLRDLGGNASLRLDVGRANKQLSITVILGAAERMRSDTRQRAA